MKFYETINKYRDKGINLYVDVDGVIAEYDIGNFDYSTIRPLKSNIQKIKELSLDSNIGVHILSICKTDRIVEEKIKWFKENADFIESKNLIFLSKEREEFKNISSKELKNNYLLENCDYSKTNILIDDDNEIIKYILKNNSIIVFQDSSLID